MCNHYRKGQPVIGWSQTCIPLLTIPVPLSGFAEHTYPKYPAPIIMQEAGQRSLVEMRWGIPRFIGDGKTKPVTNARRDKLLGRAWRACAETRRCLIPASGYFEPGRGPVGARGEILFTVKERPMFFFAGLWDLDGTGSRTFTMVTTEPNEFVARFHDRMPVVLEDAEAETWLGEKPLASEHLHALCRGLPSDALESEDLPARLTVVRPEKPTPPESQPTLF